MKIPGLIQIERHVRHYKNKFKQKMNLLSEIAEISAIKTAIIDPHIGLLTLRLKEASVLQKYHHVFYKIKENDICIDCGANIGRVSDMFLQMGAEVHAFEPHRDLYNMLLYKYKGNSKIKLHNQAVGAENTKMPFRVAPNESEYFLTFTQGASVCVFDALGGYETVADYDTEVIDLCEYLQENIVNKGKRVYILKIDIEGAEWDLLEKIIQTKIYEYCDYIFCEEHSRFVQDGNQRLEKINNLINENNIKNIYLDWV